MRPIALMKVALAAMCLAAVASSAAHASLDILVDKSSQRMTVVVDGVKRYTWKVSTGKLGYATPSGTFQPFRMERDHYSDEWDNAPMPYSIFFTYQGHAIHGSYYTSRLGSAVSHGCIRLAPRNAATLYSLVAREGMGNTRVIVAGGKVAVGDALAPITRQIKKIVPKVKSQFWWTRRR